MAGVRMHADEIATDPSLVRRLLAAQFPEWADLAIEPVRSAGTDNAIYRLGDDMVVRLPRVGWAVAQVEKDHRWLPRLAPHLPLAIPVPLRTGTPSEDYPFPWAVHRWLDGESAIAEPVADPRRAATDLGLFVLAMQRVDASNGPPSSRGGPLASKDQGVREAIDSLHDTLDVEATAAAWDAALAAPAWKGRPGWTHGDLLPGNLLIRQGRLSAVIDFGVAGIGDPACDMLTAWAFLSPETRDVFRGVVGADDATWARGRGWALCFGLNALPYYRFTNPVLAGIARQAIDAVLADPT
jgi:aminoglycoside phosphotransferase (APT) family kinase protein